MKIFGYLWVKYSQFEQIKLELAKRKDQMLAALEFVKSITQGNLEITFNATADDNTTENALATSLGDMRDQMKKISIEEKQRHWTTEGLAKFSEILRGKNDSLSVVSDSILCNLIKYLGVNQGAFYFINDDKPEDVFIELGACYAYGRKKHIEQRIEIGEGLTGQAVLEKSTIYMTIIPENYIKITSGLGEASPRNLLIVPLKLEEKVFGLVELASFDTIQRYKIEFLERLGESIASTIASVKGNEKTKKLLHETQAQAEQMRAQEEEMRQNMEEITAVQEEMQRILKEVQGKEQYMNELIDSSSDSILVLDRSYKVLSANKTLQQSYSGVGIEVVKGLDVSKLFNETEWPKYKAFYDRSFNGETHFRTELFESHGFQAYFLIQNVPIRDNDGKIVAVAVFAKDVSELMKSKKMAEDLAAKEQQKNEELKAQQEALQQNMEELSATQEEMQNIIIEVQKKENYLNDIINISKDIIFTVDRDYKIVSFNQAMKKGLERVGVKVEKGYCLLDIFPEKEKAFQKTLYDKAFKGESFERTDHFHHNGIEVYSIVTYAPLVDENKEVYAVAVFSKDISETHFTLREVKQKERELDEIINASTDSIWTIDLEYKLKTFNKNFIRVFAARGVTLMKDMDMIQILPEQEREIQRKIYSRVFAGEDFELTQTFTFEGIETHVSLNYNTLRDENNKITGVAMYAKDVTSRILAEKKVEKLLKESQQQIETLKLQEEKLHQNLEDLDQLKQDAENIKIRADVYAQSMLLVETDAKGKIIDFNNKLMEVSGFKWKELMAKHYTILIDIPEQLLMVCSKNLHLGKTWKGIIKNTAKDGSHYWVDATIVPTFNSLGKIEKFLATGYHICNDKLGMEMYTEQARKLE